MRTLKDTEVNLSEEIIKELQALGQRYDLDKIVLFGSRAKRTNYERSDIDISVSIKDVVAYTNFMEDLESLNTLLMIDVVNTESIAYSNSIKSEIEKDGVIIYEKV